MVVSTGELVESAYTLSEERKRVCFVENTPIVPSAVGWVGAVNRTPHLGLKRTKDIFTTIRSVKGSGRERKGEREKEKGREGERERGREGEREREKEREREREREKDKERVSVEEREGEGEKRENPTSE